MVQYLKELLLGPWCRALGTEVIKNEYRRSAHLFEESVVGHLTVGLVGSTQVVEQIRHDDEEGRLTAFDAAVGNGGRNMGLSGARRPVEDEPTLGLFGEGPRVRYELSEQLAVARIGAAAVLDEVGEGQSRQRAEGAVLLQSVEACILA